MYSLKFLVGIKRKLFGSHFCILCKMKDEESEKYDHIFKILIIGDSGVGKSSILVRFTDDNFEEDQPCTIGIYRIQSYCFYVFIRSFFFHFQVSPPYNSKGVDFKTKEIKVNSKLINLTIWDTGNKITNRCTDIENCFVKACVSFDIGE
jgi:GTPase SAR1 family protein